VLSLSRLLSLFFAHCHSFSARSRMLVNLRRQLLTSRGWTRERQSRKRDFVTEITFPVSSLIEGSCLNLRVKWRGLKLSGGDCTFLSEVS
jgi:hypothetical protein